MELVDDRGDSVKMCEGEDVEMVLRGAGEDEMRGKHAPCGFDQTFLKFDAWFESMRGDGGRKRIPKNENRRYRIERMEREGHSRIGNRQVANRKREIFPIPC
ncbi:MAG: hypothetical protein KAT65_16385, partial [Methanophagales archaeon]|nr:hypothetical protein [Methanophagales archaeon]